MIKKLSFLIIYEKNDMHFILYAINMYFVSIKILDTETNSVLGEMLA